MNTREYERLKRQFLQKRDARISQAEADYRRDTEALEIVWKAAREQQGHPAEVPASTKEPRAPAGRSTGIRKAIRDAYSEYTSDFNTDQVYDKVKLVYPDVKRQTVADALLRMATKGEIEPVTRGRGRRPAVYRPIRREGEQPAPVNQESEGLPM
ncbi:MAG: hypothetical protein M3416_04455 [Acidobacteriota bacterium]|nr:hypothetical protein [Acidobacteriota bacterium]